MKTLLETIGSMDEYKDGWPCVTEFKVLFKKVTQAYF
jgi:hypothetical protein